MDSDKLIIMRAFNKLFFEFLDDIISVYPDNIDMLTSRESFATFKKMNPTSIVKVWYSGVYCKYSAQIDAGDIEFFTNKDYKSDLKEVNNLQTVLDTINKVREPIKNMGLQNREIVTKYIQDLSKLSTVYYTLTSSSK
jgi:hypothetical protein